MIRPFTTRLRRSLALAACSILAAVTMAEAQIPPHYGDGSDGDLVVSTTHVLTATTSLASGHPSGRTTLEVASAGGFSAGDEVLVLQVQGLNAGRYEFHTVATVGGMGLNLSAPLANSYSSGASGNRAMVTRVPHYQTV